MPTIAALCLYVKVYQKTSDCCLQYKWILRKEPEPWTQWRFERKKEESNVKKISETETSPHVCVTYTHAMSVRTRNIFFTWCERVNAPQQHRRKLNGQITCSTRLVEIWYFNLWLWLHAARWTSLSRLTELLFISWKSSQRIQMNACHLVYTL